MAQFLTFGKQKEEETEKTQNGVGKGPAAFPHEADAQEVLGPRMEV